MAAMVGMALLCPPIFLIEDWWKTKAEPKNRNKIENTCMFAFIVFYMIYMFLFSIAYNFIRGLS